LRARSALTPAVSMSTSPGYVCGERLLSIIAKRHRTLAQSRGSTGGEPRAGRLLGRRSESWIASGENTNAIVRAVAARHSRPAQASRRPQCGGRYSPRKCGCAESSMHVAPLRLQRSRWSRGCSRRRAVARGRVPTAGPPARRLHPLGWSDNTDRVGDPGAADHDDRPAGLNSTKRRLRSLPVGERRRGSCQVGRGGSEGLRNRERRPSISAFLAAGSSSRLRNLVISCLISRSSVFSCHVRR
jgi:hypothetical protein